MGKLVRGASSAALYLALATLLSQVILGGFLVVSGRLDATRRAQLAAIVRGEAYVPASELSKAQQVPTSGLTQVSLEDLAAARAGKLRDLELREEALRKGLETLDAKRLALLQEKQDFEGAQVGFQKELRELREGSIAQGEDNVRSILSKIKPKQAKEQLMQMVEKGEINNVVSLLATMPTANRTKIIGEFKTAEDAQTLDELLRLMRQGIPEVDLIDQAQQNLDRQAPRRDPANPAPNRTR